MEEVDRALEASTPSGRQEREDDAQQERRNHRPPEEGDGRERDRGSQVRVARDARPRGRLGRRRRDRGEAPGAPARQVPGRHRERHPQVDGAADQEEAEVRPLVLDPREELLEDAELDEVQVVAGADRHRERGGRHPRRDAHRHHDRERDDADADGGADAVERGEEEGGDERDDPRDDERPVARQLHRRPDQALGDPRLDQDLPEPRAEDDQDHGPRVRGRAAVDHLAQHLAERRTRHRRPQDREKHQDDDGALAPHHGDDADQEAEQEQDAEGDLHGCRPPRGGPDSRSGRDARPGPGQTRPESRRWTGDCQRTPGTMSGT